MPEQRRPAEIVHDEIKKERHQRTRVQIDQVLAKEVIRSGSIEDQIRALAVRAARTIDKGDVRLSVDLLLRLAVKDVDRVLEPTPDYGSDMKSPQNLDKRAVDEFVTKLRLALELAEEVQQNIKVEK